MKLSDTVFSINGIAGRINTVVKPSPYALYNYANGYINNLSKEQIKAIEKIIDSDYKIAKKFLKDSLSTAKTA